MSTEARRLFMWRSVEALRRYSSGMVAVLARSKFEAVETAVATARSEDLWSLEDCRADLDIAADLDARYAALRAELNAKKPDEDVTAVLVLGSE